MAGASPETPAPGPKASEPASEVGADYSSSNSPSVGKTVSGTGLTRPPKPNPSDYLEVKAEKARATLLIRGSVARDGVPLTRETVAEKLRAAKVTHGVDWAVVDNAISLRLYDKTLIIAAAKAPGASLDAYIEERIKIDPDVKPVLAKDGHADYRNVDNIHQVRKGDVIAVKHPARQGEPGYDVFGHAQSAPVPKDAKFKLGLGTEVTSDGLALVASTGGYVYHQAGAICVGVTYTLAGDVDFHTGNLHYHGDIVIQGSVTDGFTVEAGGDVTVEGTLDGAKIISRAGKVTVKSGAFGHGKACIKAKTGVHLHCAQDMEIECEGEVAVEKGLRNCKVTAESIKADQSGCAVVGGVLKAYSDIALAVMGGEGCHTQVCIVDRLAEAAKARMRVIDDSIDHAAPKLEALEKKLHGMKALAERANGLAGASLGSKGKLSPRLLAEMKASLEQYALLRRETQRNDEEKEALQAELDSAGRHTGKFSVSERMIWGGVLDLYGHRRELEVADAGKEWVWNADGLVARSILAENPPGLGSEGAA